MKNDDNFVPEFYLKFLDVTKIFDYIHLGIKNHTMYEVVDFDSNDLPLIIHQGNLITLFPEEIRYIELIEKVEAEKHEVYKKEEDYKMLGNDDRLTRATSIEVFKAAEDVTKILKLHSKKAIQNVIDSYLKNGQFEELKSLKEKLDELNYEW